MFRLSLDQAIRYVNQSAYKLDTSGVAGLLGGDNTVDALETIHLYAGRRWAGWYNYPGTITVAKRFGQMVESRLWHRVFPGANETPAMTFHLAGKSGPEYIGSFSGTKVRTGYLGYLMTQGSIRTDFLPKPLSLVKQDGGPGRKTGSSATVMIISLPPRPPERSVSGGTNQKLQSIPVNPKSKFDPPLALWSIVPSSVSILACVFCIIGKDDLCASLILLGILSSGFSSFVLGTAALKIHVPVPSGASPAGDGLMFPHDGSIIVLKGEEGDVNVITKGEFELDYSTGMSLHSKYPIIGFSTILLYLQFVAQLLFIPRCTFFGQIMFIASFVASAGYHLHVASHGREIVHFELLTQTLFARMEKWTPGTRTQMAVFVCLVLGDGRQYPLRSDPDQVLTHIIPNDTAVWKYWRRKVVKELGHFWDAASPYCYAPSIQVAPVDEVEADEYSRFTDGDKELLHDLIDDAWCVFRKYTEWRESESRVWEGGGGDYSEEKGPETARFSSKGSPV